MIPLFLILQGKPTGHSHAFVLGCNKIHISLLYACLQFMVSGDKLFIRSIQFRLYFEAIVDFQITEMGKPVSH